jgi:D-tyrosyl-tRNA(Tyr) deacylase
VLALIQRVREARVDVDGACVGRIAEGLLVLVCAQPTDSPAHADKLVARLLKLRIFSDEAGRMNRSLLDLQALWEAGPRHGAESAVVGRAPADAPGLLIVSQFTLAADTRSGNRPSFTAAAPAELGRQLYDTVLARARAQFPRVEAGVFGADMQVHLVNDGPVTIPLEV